MLHLLLTHWLWVFGALALGIVFGWITYLRVALRWTDLSVQIVVAVLAFGAIAAFAKVVPGRYGYWLDLGVILAVAYAVGGFIGRALRDLAEFTPATTKAGAAAYGATASTATAGSYLFRDALASMGTGAPYMRTAFADGAPARQPLGLSDGALDQASAPAPGGYTFPKTLPFADATVRQAAAPAPGVRRHWSWPRPAGTPPYVTPEFTGSPGGYIFPVAVQVPAGVARDGTARPGLYRHWSWRGGAGAPSTSAPAATGSPAPTSVAEGSQPAPAAPEPMKTPMAAAMPAASSGETGSGAALAEDKPSTAPPSPRAVAPDSAGPTSVAYAAPTDPAAPPAAAAPLAPRGATGAAPAPAAPASATSPAADRARASDESLVGDVARSNVARGEVSGAPVSRGHAGSADTTTPIDGEPTAPAPETTTPAAVTRSTPADARSAASPSTVTTTGPSGVRPSAGPASADAGPAGSPAPVPSSDAPVSGGVSSESSGTAAGSMEPPLDSPASTASPGAVSPATGQPTFSDKTSGATPEAAAPGGATGAQAAASIASTGVAGAPTFEAVSDASAGGAIGAADSPVPSPPTATTPAEAGLPAAPPTTPGQPATIAAVPGEDRHPGARPEGLMTAREDRADDLTRIRGIGPQNEGRLHGLGIWHFDQIAGWSLENVRWVGSYLAFPGRIDREKWVEQATTLASGGDTGFSKRVRAGTVATSHDDGSQGQSNIVEPTTLNPATPRRPRR